MNIKQIIKEEYAKVLLEQHLLEAETPEHFGGGENIDVYGYNTENFDICKSAVMLFTKLKEKNLEGMAVDHAKKAAEHIDNVFGIEKEVVERGSATPEQVEDAVDNNMLFGYELGSLAMHIDDDLTRDSAFHKLHVMEIVNRYDSTSLGNEQEPVSEGKLNEKMIYHGISKIAARVSALRLANAIADLHGARVKVHDLEYTEGKPTSFELSLDGEKFAGGSYTIKLDGDIVNDAARSRGEREGPIYGKIGDTKADFIRGIKRSHRDWKRFMKKENISEARPKKVTKQMWAKMDEYQRMDALLTVVKDPDNAEKFLDKKWNQLPSGFERDMFTESTKEYGKSLEKIAKDRQLAMLSKKDKETLLKIADLMKRANEGTLDISEEQLAVLKEKLVFYVDKKGRKRRFDTDPAANRRYRRG